MSGFSAEPEDEADRDQDELRPEAPLDDVAVEVPFHAVSVRA